MHSKPLPFPVSLRKYDPACSLSRPSASQTKIQRAFSTASGRLLSDSSILLSAEQKKLISDLCRCRTPECGFHLEACTECGYRRIRYNSCGNRSCPVCGSLKKEIWIDRRNSEVIDAAYYHAVFTCPHELNPLFLANRKLLFSFFHKCVGLTVVELSSDPAYLGAVPGVILVLHTWSQKLLFHPHIHAVISGGGLTPDRKLKTIPGDSFFIAESVLAAKLRGKFLSMLDDAYRQKKLFLPADMAHLSNSHAWNAFRDQLYHCKWVAKVKETFHGRGNAVEYLGRYIYKAAITDARIVSVSEDEVVFTARGSDGKQSCRIRLTPLEFVKRFLLHVLPKGFQKVRYYGYLNNRCRKDNLVLIFNLQGYRQFIQKYKDMKPAEIILHKWGHDINACPHCHAHAMVCIYSTRGRHPQLE